MVNPTIDLLKTQDVTSNVEPGDSLAFRGIFIASFAVFLVVALLAQVLTWHWRTWLPGAENEKSLVGGVRSAVYTAMSHLS